MEDSVIEKSIATLGYALLALIARQERSGYDLMLAMKRPIGFFWQARQSQIYSELQRLSEQELVVHRVIEQQERPDKKIYSITPDGEAALRQWLTEPTAERPSRDELVLKAYSIWLADPEKAVKLFRIHEDLHMTRLTEYERMLNNVEREYGGEPEVDMPAFGNYATLMCGIGYEREYIAWCRWVAERLERYLDRQREQ